MPFIRFIVGIASLLSMMLSLTASAANRIVILENANRPVAREVAHELESSGFETRILEDSPSIVLKELADAQSASAAIRLNLKGNQVEVWVADRITGKMVMRTISLNPGDAQENSIIVLAAVELLRASLMEIYASKSQQGEVAATEQTRRFAKPTAIDDTEENGDPEHISAGFLSIGAGGAVLGKNSGIGGHSTISVTLAFNSRIHFSALGHFPAGAFNLESQAGSTDVYPFLFGAQTAVLLRSEKKRLRPFAGIGLGVALFLAKGKHSAEYEQPNATLQSHMETVLIPIPFVCSGILFKLTEQLTLRLATTIGVTTATTRVKIADHTVAQLGRPVFFFDGGLDITLW